MASITTINSTDLISAGPTTLNGNFTALNAELTTATTNVTNLQAPQYVVLAADGNIANERVLTAGSGISITDGGAGSTVTIAATGGGSGTVTSVDVAGGTTGLTTSGGPITTTGTITLSGTLSVANGGTGATTAAAARTALSAAENVKYWSSILVDDTTDVTATSFGTTLLNIPFNCTITGARAYVKTAGTTGTMSVDVNVGGASILTGTIDIASAATTGTGTIASASYTADSDITIDVDSVHTTAAKGLVVVLTVTPS